MVFIGGSKPRVEETEKDLLFRRMRTCWMEKGKNYGMKEFLMTKMTEAQIETEVDGRWARFSLMGAAPLIINPKIWINRQGEERRFQVRKIQRQPTLSECATRIQKFWFLKTLPQFISDKLVIHKWDQFPDRDLIVIETTQSREYSIYYQMTAMFSIMLCYTEVNRIFESILSEQEIGDNSTDLIRLVLVCQYGKRQEEDILHQGKKEVRDRKFG